MSETIYQLLAKVIAEVPAVAKKERNQAQNFSFRGIDAVVNAVSPVLIKHGVIVAPTLLNYVYEQIPIGGQGKLAGHARVSVQYTFYGPQGDSISASVAAEAMDYGDKATAKAMSVAFRTALLQTLTLPTDDKDPDQDTYERSTPTPAKPAKSSIDNLGSEAPVSGDNKARIVNAFADLGMEIGQALTLAGVTSSEWDDLRETGRHKLLAAHQRAKTDMPPPDPIETSKPRVQSTSTAAHPDAPFNDAIAVRTPATITPIVAPVPDEEKAAHPSNGGKTIPATKAQIAAIRALLRGGGFIESSVQLGMASEQVGRTVESFDELTVDEAASFKDTLQVIAPKKD